MRYLVAIVVWLLILCAMFGYLKFMDAKLAQWESSSAALPQVAIVAIHVANAIRNYWIVAATVSLIACLGGAGAAGARERD